MRFMIYGVSGYTGRLAARRAQEEGLKPIVAGRNEERVRAEAERFGFDSVVFDIDDRARAVRALVEVDAVFNAAGPYSATAQAMTDACLAAGTHYVDVTAENQVFADLQKKDQAAREAGVMLLPGMGAGGAPTDCLAAWLKSRLPDATHLEFFGGSLEVVSRGTAKSAMEAVHLPTQVRRGGELVALASPLRARIEIEGESVDSVTVPLCDVLVTYWSTGIPNITTYVEESGAVRQMSSVPGWLKRLLATSTGQRLIKWQLDRGVEGPTDEQRKAGFYRNVGIVRNEAGAREAAVARGPEGYTYTALSAIAATRRAAAGEAKPGYQTASTAYGNGFFASLDGCRIERLDPPAVERIVP